jgi:hypothetical protein
VEDGAQAVPRGDDGRGKGMGPARWSGGMAWPAAALMGGAHASGTRPIVK